MNNRRSSLRARLLGGAALAAAITCAGPALAQAKPIDIAPQPLTTALYQLGVQTGQQIIFSPALATAKMSGGVQSADNVELALNQLLAGTGLTYERTADAILIKKAAADPQSQGAAGGGAEVEALIVTAQKREEDIQDVPIAISAFTQEELTNRQVAGGPDLITQIPNFTFTKTNFTGYSIQIRGIGTQAISATTDPAVAVAFNNTPFIRNRFFEQEFFDLQRVEVLRGPQGTLYGRNATAGVVNLISAKPKFFAESKVSADIGNYNSSRLEGMVNIPLVEDVAALRLAGAWTKRDGYATNQMTGNRIDGRDLWSTRLSLRFEPTDAISANLIWEHFEESDDRLRSGKQLCKKDPGPDEIGGLVVPPSYSQGGAFGLRTYISQGCLPVSLYSDEAFQTPNGYALPFYGPTGNIGNPVDQYRDPYASTFQSRDLRVIESTVEPDYRARTDTAQLQVSVDIGDSLTLDSETAYATDFLWSLQDYNRFTTVSQAFEPTIGARPGVLDENNVFCDPQLGCSDRLLLVDVSTAKSTHFSQEFRLSSDYEGPFNFSLGANFLRYDTEDKYYLFINTMTMLATVRMPVGETYEVGVSDNIGCINAPYRTADPYLLYNVAGCTYIDPNPIGSLNDQGRNYFLSRNPYRLISYAAFGEAYYEITSNLKLTAGLRWTVDKKHAPQIPSWMGAANIAGEYPVAAMVDQEWREPTGRVTLDWKPDFGFTDETLLYASYAHGYKAGGANPPPPVVVIYAGTLTPDAVTAMQTHPMTFDPEFVDAFEVGTKNTLLGGALTLNLGAFYYDYDGYQTSEIVDRSAVNSNFDAKIWGAELEADWRPLENLRLGFRGGYQKTRMADGSSAIDLMDRTAGNPDWILVRPFPTIPSNCIMPAYVASAGGRFNVQTSYYNVSASGACVDAYYDGLDPVTGQPYAPGIDYGALLGPAFADYPGWDPATAPNGGRGIEKDLSGNELPNAPHWTANLTVDYTIPLPNDWLLTLHADAHYQSEAWARVINSDPYDRIRSYSTGNVAAIFQNDNGWKVMAYVKNVTDETAITGAFLNSDDTGLTTNVFLTEPRLYGLRVTKDFDGGPLFGGGFGGDRHRPLTLEIGGAAERIDAPNEVYTPDFIGEFPAGLLPLGEQEEDLDWGDGREVKLTYQARNGWHASAAARFGRTNGRASGMNVELGEGGYLIGPPIVPFPKYYVDHPGNYGVVTDASREEYQLVDFVVGKDVGLGLAGGEEVSKISGGIRYAELESSSQAIVSGMPDLYLPPVGIILYRDGKFFRHRAQFSAERRFEGAGPVVSWDAAIPLAGGEDRGRVLADISLGGGVLFGKRKTKVEYEARDIEFQGQYFSTNDIPVYAINTDIAASERQSSKDATVPVVGASLGLSYAVGGVKLSTGYRWERYFDALDGGIDEPREYDRTIDGPYFKLAVGFGG